jgi:S-adenosylmethionine hydrolase
MGRRFDTVSFLTDYGLDDEFVGVVKSVLRDLAPHVTVVDLTHGVRPFDVRGGSLALARAISYVAEGVVLAVVDPGVGTARRAVAVEVAGGAGVLVGPDNGLLAPAVAVVGGADRAVELTNVDYHLDSPGATFAGRDVFAPVTAHLCNGVDLAELGPLVDPGLLLPGTVPLPRDEPDGLHAEVLWVDRFGNCQLNVTLDDLPADTTVVAVTIDGERRVGHVATTFGALTRGQLGVVVDSQGMCALAFDQHSAAADLRIGTGDAVVLSPIDDGGAPAPTTAVTLGPRR